MNENIETDSNKTNLENEVKKSADTLSGALLMTSVAGVSLLGGFGFTVSLAKKKDPTMFNQGLVGGAELAESGGTLALRALARGTMYSFTAFAVLGFAVWKFLGVKNMQDFRSKMQSYSIKPQAENPQEYKDIKTLRQLADYLIKRDKLEKEQKSSRTSVLQDDK